MDEIQQIKVNELPLAATLTGLEVLGFNASTNEAVRAAISLLEGLDGKPIELQKTTTHIQWRVQGGTWSNLIALSDIKGEKGDTGDTGTPNSLSIGTVSSGETPSATITGLSPSQTLNLTLPKGDIGPKGDKGDTGIGVPTGGTTGQQLVKKSNIDYDFEWQTPAGAGDMLKSVYDSDGDGIVDNAEKVGGFTVETNVPANAKFTDTVYTHPASHPASMITESTTRRFVTDTEKSTWNAKSDLALGTTSGTAYRGDYGNTAYTHSQAAHAPSNAQKNSDITKAEIEAKLTGDISSHTHSAYVPTSRTVAGKALTGNITLAKGDVGLGNVDNTSDANKPVSTAQQTALNAKIDASKFQVVTELPASPTTGVFYFVKE